MSISLQKNTQHVGADNKQPAYSNVKKIPYRVLWEKIVESGILEVELMKWAHFVNLADPKATQVNDLSCFAIERIIRSWESIQGLIKLERNGNISPTT